jgi:hypothetical protein
LVVAGCSRGCSFLLIRDEVSIMAATPSFDSVWAKIERAKEHADNLERHITETFEARENCPRIGARFDPKSGRNVVFISEMPDLDNFFQRTSLMLGDAIHNLRSALDHLIYQLSLREQGSALREEKTMFVIADVPTRAEGRHNWEDQSHRWLSQIRPCERTILERYQGYHRLDNLFPRPPGPDFHPLVMLRDLDDMDKHRLLNTVLVSSDPLALVPLFEHLALVEAINMGNVDERLEALKAGAPATLEEFGPMELGTVMASARKPADLQSEVKVVGHVLPRVALPGGWIATHIVGSLGAIAAAVIREFEPFP